MKIGCVSLDTSHPKALATQMEKNCLDMNYEYLWDKGFRQECEKEWFVKRFGLAGQVENIEDMVDKVDMGFIHACNWEKHVEHAMPFINAGKPVFIDKPVVGSMKDIQKVRELVAKGAKIYGASACRYAEEVQNFMKLPKETRGDVISIFCTVGNNEFDYAIHAVEILSEIAGSKAVSCQYTGTAKAESGMVCETYNIHFENGIIGTYHVTFGRNQKFNVTVVTTAGIFHFQIDNGKILCALLMQLYHQWKSGKSDICDVETLLNCSEVMICGKKSRDEKNGALVTLADLTDDDKFDGYAFEEGYAAGAGIAYKD